MLESKKDKQDLILRELARHGHITRAAAKADVSRQTIWRWTSSDKKFAVAYRVAMKEGAK